MTPPIERRGEVRARTGKDGAERFHFRVFLSREQRPEVVLVGAANRAEADDRAAWIVDLLGRLERADRAELCDRVVRQAAKAANPKARKRVEAVVEGIIGGGLLPKGTTFKQFAERWITGDLHRAHPDYVRKKDHSDDRSRLAKYIYPFLADLPIASITIHDAELVMRELPAELSPATRRHVAQILYRVFGLAAFPCRVILASPLPKGFLPLIEADKAKACLYPDEDARLVASPDVPALERLAFGILVREGMRVSELLESEWWQWDLSRGMFTLDVNKTKDARTWKLRPDVVRAMRAHHVLEGRPKRGRPFASLGVEDEQIARLLRRRLRAAGIEREELFVSTKARLQIRAHDLRATFVTLALAAGRSETWVADRTGHKSSAMIARYRRRARQLVDVGHYDDLVALDEALGWTIVGPHIPPCTGVASCTCAALAANKLPTGAPALPPPAGAPVTEVASSAASVAASGEVGIGGGLRCLPATSRPCSETGFASAFAGVVGRGEDGIRTHVWRICNPCMRIEGARTDRDQTDSVHLATSGSPLAPLDPHSAPPPDRRTTRRATDADRAIVRGRAGRFSLRAATLALIDLGLRSGRVEVSP